MDSPSRSKDMNRDEQRALERARFAIEATEALCALMEAQKVSRADLARLIDRSPAFLTKILRGSHNFTIATLADLFAELGASVHLELAPLGDGIRVPDIPYPESFTIPHPNWGDSEKKLLRKREFFQHPPHREAPDRGAPCLAG